MEKHKIKLIECPRDAMQGWPRLISTEEKVTYLNSLLEVGFDTLDFGSFVSPKAIPQMADTKDVIPLLKLNNTKTKLLAIIANERGAQDAVQYDEIKYLGFPFSISETFQQKNANSSLADALLRVEEIQKLCQQRNKELVLYISMAFGNPYGDDYNAEVALTWVEKLAQLGIKIFAMSDTVGVSNPDNISYIFSNLEHEFKNTSIEFGAHFHSTPETRIEKITSAIENNCFRFDSSLKGIGGCPMAQNDLVGNMDTEDLVQYLIENNYPIDLNMDALIKSAVLAKKLFIY